MRVLEAGTRGAPCVLLLHGFPELAYSWRKVMPILAAAGYHVIAPDQRGYGQTTGWDAKDLDSFFILNIVEDAVQLLKKLNIEKCFLVGHDFGSLVAGYAALTHPARFHSVTLMSAPFGGPPSALPNNEIHRELAALGRKHYQWYYSTPQADADMRHDLHAFLRAYYHMKSADWPANQPFKLKGWTAAELAKLPTYYVMKINETMAQTVAPEMPPGEAPWLTDAELAVYTSAFERTGFQASLNWYGCMTSPRFVERLIGLKNQTIDIPACYIAGAADWGMYQKPGELEKMQTAHPRWMGTHIVPGAGHWVQQERPAETARILVDFFRQLSI